MTTTPKPEPASDLGIKAVGTNSTISWCNFCGCDSERARIRELEAKEPWTLRLEETVIGFAVAVDCFRNGLASSEDVSIASDRVVEIGLQINCVREDLCPDCGSDLDTGWECNGCGRDWMSIGSAIVERTTRAALADQPKPEPGR